MALFTVMYFIETFRIIIGNLILVFCGITSNGEFKFDGYSTHKYSPNAKKPAIPITTIKKPATTTIG
jgi:hypothetical protein